MRVIVNNERIRLYMLNTKQDKFDLARLCHISVSQVNNLLWQKNRSMRDETIIRFCQGTGLRFNDIFTLEDVEAENEKFFTATMVDYLEEYRKAVISYYKSQTKATKKDMN